MHIKCLLLLCVVMSIQAGDEEVPTCHFDTEDDLKDSWKKYKAEYNKSYYQAEDKHRMALYAKTCHEITLHNDLYSKDVVSYTMGLNEFSDWTNDEVDSLFGKDLSELNDNDVVNFIPTRSVELPKEVNWVEKGFVTAVKNQRNCGCGYAFAAVGAVESHKIIKKNHLIIPLSEQNILDCSTGFGNNGCKGGNALNSFQYIANGGIDSESYYPYEAKRGICRYDPAHKVNSISGLVMLKQTESEIQRAVAEVGPVTVAIAANKQAWKKYHGGVFHNTNCSSTLNHAVLIVGYGHDEKEGDYWLLKNSWGTKYGLNGFMKYARNRQLCGINKIAGYPLL